MENVQNTIPNCMPRRPPQITTAIQSTDGEMTARQFTKAESITGSPIETSYPIILIYLRLSIATSTSRLPRPYLPSSIYTNISTKATTEQPSLFSEKRVKPGMKSKIIWTRDMYRLLSHVGGYLDSTCTRTSRLWNDSPYMLKMARASCIIPTQKHRRKSSHVQASTPPC